MKTVNASKSAVGVPHLAQLVRDAQSRRVIAPMVTEESRRAGDVVIRRARRIAARRLREGIGRGEFLTAPELAARWAVDQAWIDNAVESNRLFFVLGPNDVKYYPALFDSADIDRQALEQVAAKLGNVPGPAKYQFFFTRSTLLRSKTPLEALRAGRLADVLTAADGYANT